jgi:tRNA-2-methylthio-N6-dimethylallyladenosine synthase
MLNNNIYIETYGCKMNSADTEIVISILKNAGFKIVENEISANIVLLNTCSIREGAENKIINRVAQIKKQNSNSFIGILGCMATHLKEELLKNKNISFIAGPDSYKKLANLINSVLKTQTKNFDIELSKHETYEDIYPARENSVNAWVTITRGCDNFCSYCVVPYTRGREKSRRPEAILKEIATLIKEGYPQITLLGQNVNSYKYDDYNFTKLLEKISHFPELKRIRFMSPHPKDLSSETLKLIKTQANICQHIHLPLQSGNTNILQKMNRHYSKEDYKNLIAVIKSILPKAVITTDIIIGFPGETEEEFADTVDVVKYAQFDSAYIFKYSERKPSLAAQKYPDDVSEESKTKRIILLNEIQKEISRQKNKAHLGEIQEILIEAQESKKSTLEFQGRNDGNKIVIIPKGNHKIGDFIKVKITDATANVLKGLPV